LLTAGAAFTALDMTTGDETDSFNVTVDGGAPVTITLGTADNTGGGTTLDLAETIAGINADLAAASSDVRVRNSLTSPGRLEFFVNSGTHTGASSSIAVGTFANGGTTPSATTAFGFGAGATDSGTDVAAGTPKTVDQLVAAINTNVSLIGKLQASNDNGKLRIMNLSTTDLTVAGINSAAGTVDGAAAAATIGGNEVRRNLVKQFNDLRDQLDKLADDACYNGVNLLRGDKLKITFNETGTSTIEVQANDEFGVVRPINSINLNIVFLQNFDVDADSSIDMLLDNLAQSVNVVRSQASDFGSKLSTVENRQDFTKAMINTLQVGADNLVLADTNEEGANMLALQTRQQLSTTALSLAAQADQAVLRLFG